MDRKIKILISTIAVMTVVALVFFVVADNREKIDLEKKQQQPEEKEITQKEYRIGFITDVHGKIKGAKKKAPDINSEAKETLIYFTEHMNKNFHPDFIMEGGDLIEGTDREGQKSIDDFKALTQYFKEIKVPTYHVIGNHETRGFTKNDWLNLTDYKETYYYFDYDGLRIVVMDGNENERIQNIGDYDKNDYYLTENQFQWLEKSLSEGRNLQKIVFIHYPCFDTPGTKMVNLEQSARLREIFSKNKVSAVFSGHTERLDFEEIDGVRYFVLTGTERSKLKYVLWLGSFAEIIVDKDVKVKLFYKKSFGEKEYRELLIPSEEFDKMEK